MKTKSVKPTSYKILYPVNRTSRRFLKAVNKIRKFFDENNVQCIPCVEQPFDILFSTKNMDKHRISIQTYDFTNKKTGDIEQRHMIKFLGSLDKRKTLMADYLRSDIIPEHNAVLLPKSISNFYNSNQIRYYCNPKYKSLESQLEKQLIMNFEEYTV